MPLRDPCSLQLKCSAAGIDCVADDRACVDRAVSNGLEVTCERVDDGARHFLYCPPGASSRDSSYVWLLLAVAVTLAVGGSFLAWFLLRKRVR